MRESNQIVKTFLFCSTFKLFIYYFHIGFHLTEKKPAHSYGKHEFERKLQHSSYGTYQLIRILKYIWMNSDSNNFAHLSRYTNNTRRSRMEKEKHSHIITTRRIELRFLNHGIKINWMYKNGSHHTHNLWCAIRHFCSLSHLSISFAILYKNLFEYHSVLAWYFILVFICFNVFFFCFSV